MIDVIPSRKSSYVCNTFVCRLTVQYPRTQGEHYIIAMSFESMIYLLRLGGCLLLLFSTSELVHFAEFNVKDPWTTSKDS